MCLDVKYDPVLGCLAVYAYCFYSNRLRTNLYTLHNLCNSLRVVVPWENLQDRGFSLCRFLVTWQAGFILFFSLFHLINFKTEKINKGW